MNKKEVIFILPVLAFIFGWFVVGHFMAGVVLGFAVVYLQSLVISPENQDNKSESVFNEGSDFIHIILLLSAAVIKADGRIYKKELHLVKTRLSHDFGPAYVERYMASLDEYLNKKIRVELVCSEVKINFDYASKIQLLHFLVGLSVTNKLIVDSEFDLLRKIARLIDVPDRSFASVLAMFNYQRIHSYQQKQNNQKQTYKSTSSSELSRAFRILEISEDAKDEEIKKAYRKLAKIHHPDRVVHLGPEFQKNAKVKFQKISDAYELIKKRRGFK